MKESQIDMTSGPVARELVSFSVPLILTSVLQLLFNAADVIVVGRFAGDESLAAVGSTSSLINLLVNLFLGLSTGANVVAASMFGARKSRELRQTVSTSMHLGVISGAFLCAAGVLFSRTLLSWMRSPPDVIGLASVYLKIYFCGMIPMMFYNFAAALLRAKGDTRRPLFILAASGALNVALNLLFVIVFSLDVAGVALATVISQSSAAVMVGILLARERDDFKFKPDRPRIDRETLIRILKVGVPAGFQGIMFSLSNVIIQSSINTFGSVVVAGNSAGISVEGFVYTSMNGFSQGALTFTSQNLGAGNKRRIKKAVVSSQLIALCVGLALGLAAAAFSESLLSIFSSNPLVIKAGSERLKVICAFYAICGMMDCMGNSVRGAGRSVTPMLVTLLGACGLRVLWLATVFQIPRFHTCLAIFVSYPVSWFVTWVAHTICFARAFKALPNHV